ncbi:MAG: alanine--tRNA ligase [Candidatus Eisenbacteria bacterium]|nr:alanine--tRNA ligase [Candidatus Eisenbacteria bacterium]
MTAQTLRAATELRSGFLDFFRERGHTVVPSSPLVPHGDPTLLFTTAGMVHFKPYYSATGDVPYTRAVSVQKSLRLTDLDNVGLTPRHDTFFEMLGNFSFGPREQGAYFKEEAIAFAWEFVTGVLGLPKERLHASIFAGEGNLPRDDEAEALWKKVGLPASRIVALGRADNFWGPAGGQGACGPCSEIYFDLGETRPADLSADAFWGERPGDEGDRYMEFWNLVFPQFDAQPDGALKALPRPGIDTGMGLERLALIMQGKRSIFETDLFAPLVEEVLSLAGQRKPGSAAQRDARIIADHVRALTFAIAEGALPGNEGAGYVLRRLLRRAVTRGRSRRGLALHRTFLAPVAERAIERFSGHYAELAVHRERVLHALEQEEAGFVQTFEAGLARLEELLARGARTLPGDDAFALHDTYGFPVELTAEIAKERGVAVDLDGFERAMEAQRTRARAASKFAKTEGAERVPWQEVTAGADSEFLGYACLAVEGATLRRRRGRGEELELVLDRTAAYAESGGQVADRGAVEGGGARAELTHVYKEGESIVHRVRLVAGEGRALLDAGVAGALTVRVAPAHRLPTMRHHTATHLLHAALRGVLGEHVRQAGSLVAPDRLRFDYTHFEPPTREQLAEIEHRVAEWVLENREVRWEVVPLERARALGAMALFGEKYGAEVRMVTVTGEDSGHALSRELCGGTHVARTGDIGAFTLVADAAIASGVRRIEALCGHEALRFLKGQAETLHRAALVLQASPAALPEQVEKLKAELERLKKAQAELQKGGLEAEMEKLVRDAGTAAGGRWVVAEVRSEADTNAVREAADRLRGQLKRGAAVLALQGGGKLTFLAAVTDDLVAEKRLRADELVRAVAGVTGGSGGGKPHLALAGGKDASKLGEALDEARRLLAQALAQ